MPLKMFAFSLLLSLPLIAQPTLSEDRALRRIQDHLILHDFTSAAKEGKIYADNYPESFSLQQAYLKALCEKGDESDAFSVFKKTKALAPSQDKEKELLEMLAWAVLSKGDSSSLLMIRLYSLLGAAFTSDAKAIPFLQKELVSSNALLRSVAVKIAANYGDAPLRRSLLKMLEDEKVWYVRLDVINALGKLREKNAIPILKRLVASPKTYPEEKASALFALTSIYESVDDAEIMGLIRSERAGLRELAAELISFWNLHEKISDLHPLLSDPSPSVRVSVLNALALSGTRQIGALPLFVSIKPLLEDPCPEVAITAAWLATILEENEGRQKLAHWIEQPIGQWKRMASSALAASGSHGSELCCTLLKKERDPYVKANLALGLIGQRREIELSGKVLYSILSENKQNLLMWQNEGNPLFRSLAPSKLRHIDQVPRYPVAVDQHVRLDLLSVLSIIGHPKALDAVKECLKDPTWGVSSTAMITLLEEGDDQSFDTIRKLLLDPDADIRLQAALILAVHGSDPAAIDTLHSAYKSMDREKKIHVLEALARVGDPSSLPFLLEILDDPFQLLRIIAASAMIQCIYH